MWRAMVARLAWILGGGAIFLDVPDAQALIVSTVGVGDVRRVWRQYSAAERRRRPVRVRRPCVHRRMYVRREPRRPGHRRRDLGAVVGRACLHAHRAMRLDSKLGRMWRRYGGPTLGRCFAQCEELR